MERSFSTISQTPLSEFEYTPRVISDNSSTVMKGLVNFKASSPLPELSRRHTQTVIAKPAVHISQRVLSDLLDSYGEVREFKKGEAIIEVCADELTSLILR